MKKTLFILSLATLALSACSKPTTYATQAKTAVEHTTTPTTSTPMTDTPQTVLDWAGEYKGIFPCADCEGIETELELNPNNRYELKETYLGKGKENESKVKGTFSFDTNNPALISLDAAGDNRKFFIGENFVEARDKVTGEAAQSKLNYTLQKEMK